MRVVEDAYGTGSAVVGNWGFPVMELERQKRLIFGEIRIKWVGDCTMRLGRK